MQLLYYRLPSLATKICLYPGLAALVEILPGQLDHHRAEEQHANQVGIAIKPLRVSEMSHASWRSMVAPTRIMGRNTSL